MLAVKLVSFVIVLWLSAVIGVKVCYGHPVRARIFCLWAAFVVAFVSCILGWL